MVQSKFDGPDADLGEDRVVRTYGALLHKEWSRGDNPSEIIHCWAEDNSPTTINVPEQLRDELVSMQNWLSRQYQRLESAKISISKAEEFFRHGKG